MAASGSATLGDVLNKQQLTDVIVSGANTSTALTDGQFVYINGATGVVVVPTGTSRPDASRIRFLEVGVDNSSGSAITDKEVETFKKNARVVAHCDGAISVGQAVRASRTTAGRCEALPDPGTGDAASTIANYLRERIGIYVGHPGEAQETANEPSAAADDEDVVIQMD